MHATYPEDVDLAVGEDDPRPGRLLDGELGFPSLSGNTTYRTTTARKKGHGTKSEAIAAARAR